MANPNEDKQPLLSMEKMTKFIWTSKGNILAAEMVLCLLVIICKAASTGCFLWSGIVELVWAVITFIIYAQDLHLLLKFFPWTDFFRAITGSLFLLITSLLCISWGRTVPGQVTGGVFGLLAAVVFGYDVTVIINYIRILKQQEGAISDVVIY